MLTLVCRRLLAGSNPSKITLPKTATESLVSSSALHHPDSSQLSEGFPASQPAFYELYNTKGQILARTHPGLVNTQKALLSFWHTSDPNSEVSLVQPISYFDRLRIREPSPTGWFIGPHIDGGGIERWEDPGYRSCYARIFEGGDSWRQHDPYDASPRLIAKQDLYDSP